MSKNYKKIESETKQYISDEDVVESKMFSYITTGDEKGFMQTLEALNCSPFEIRNPENGDTLIHAVIKSRQANVTKAVFNLLGNDSISILSFMEIKNKAGESVFDVLKANDEGPFDLFSNFCKKMINSIQFEALLQKELLVSNNKRFRD